MNTNQNVGVPAERWGPDHTVAAYKRRGPDPMVEPVLTSIPGAQAILGLSRSSVWLLIQNGEIESLNIGKRRLIVVASIHRLIERRLIRKAEQTAPTGAEVAEAPAVPKRRPNGRAKPRSRRSSKAKSAAA
jgi:hypothetical protein